MVIVGRFAGAYGVRGWLKLASFTEPAEKIFSYKHWHSWMPRSGWQMLDVQAGDKHGDGLLVKINGIDNREANLALRGREIAIEREQLAPAAEDEYYLCDLPGCAVLDQSSGEVLGQVKRLQPNYPQDLLVIERSDGSQCLLPLLAGVVILQVDIAAKQIWIDKEASLL